MRGKVYLIKDNGIDFEWNFDAEKMSDDWFMETAEAYGRIMTLEEFERAWNNFGLGEYLPEYSYMRIIKGFTRKELEGFLDYVGFDISLFNSEEVSELRELLSGFTAPHGRDIKDAVEVVAMRREKDVNSYKLK